MEKRILLIKDREHLERLLSIARRITEESNARRIKLDLGECPEHETNLRLEKMLGSSWITDEFPDEVKIKIPFADEPWLDFLLETYEEQRKTIRRWNGGDS
jgi:hypothetical protein